MIERPLANFANARPRLWLALVVLGGVFLAFFSQLPHYRGVRSDYPGTFAQFPGTDYGRAITWWLDHPFSPVPVSHFFPPEHLHQGINLGMSSHCDKLTFRATLPLLNQVFRGGIWTLVVACHLATIATYILVYLICLRHTGERTSAAWVTWAFAASWAGFSGYYDFIYGDAVAVALLTAAVFSSRPAVISSCVLLAGFTDERGLVAAPLVALFHIWRVDPPFSRAPRPAGTFSFLRISAPIIVAVAGYGLIRLSLQYFGGIHAGYSLIAHLETIRHNFQSAYPSMAFSVFEGLWMFPAVFILSLILIKGPTSRPLISYLALLALASGPTLVVYDVNRSLFYLLPGVLISICFAPLSIRSRSIVSAGAFFVSVLWLSPPNSVLRYLETFLIRVAERM